MSAVSKIEAEPDPFPFALRRDRGGCWIVEGPGNGCGGLFVSREAALHFMRRERRAMAELARHACYRPGADTAATRAGAGIRLVPGSRA